METYLNFHLPVLILLAFGIVLVKRTNLSRQISTLLLIYLGTNFFVESTANYLDSLKIRNIQIYNLGMIFEVIAFLLIFYTASTDKRFKKFIKGAIVIFVLFSLSNTFYFQKFRDFYSNTYTIGSFILMFTSLYYLFKFIVNRDEINPMGNFMFWFSVGVLFCYLGNLFYLSILNRLLSSEKELARGLVIISITVNSLMYLLISIGTICNKKQIIL